MSHPRLPWILAGALAVLLFISQCSAGAMLEARDAQLDSLRTATLAARAETMGWEVRFAQEAERGQTLARWLQTSRDSTSLLAEETAELAREVELLEGRVAALVEMYATARGQIEAHDATVHTSAEGVDSITGDVSDGLLSAHVTATVEPPTVAIPSYSIELALALALVEGADGRSLVTARAADERVSIAFGELYVEPPAPVEFCGLGTRVKDHGRGYLLLRTVEEIVRRVLP